MTLIKPLIYEFIYSFVSWKKNFKRNTVPAKSPHANSIKHLRQ